MVAHQIVDALPGRAAAPQALADRDGEIGADGGVAVERDALVPPGRRDRLADVVEEEAERERLGGAGTKLLDREERVAEDVAFGMIVGRLLDAPHARHLGEDRREQPRFGEQLEAASRRPFGEDLHDLVADALGGHVGDGGRRGADRVQRRGLDREAEAGGEADGAQHAQPIFGDARSGVADGADDAGAQVGLAGDEVDHLARQGVEEERVDGEVAAERVLPRRAEVHGARPPAVDVGGVGAERRDLDRHAVGDDQHDAELGAHGNGPREERLHGLGRRARRDVVVERLAAEQPVADAAAGEVRIVPGRAQPADELSGDRLPLRHRRK